MLEQLSVNVVPVNSRPDRPPSPSLQGRNCQDMPDMDADGVETRHFCHRARSCSLKAVCAHPRSTHRRRGVHRLHTVDRRGTFLIPLFAHSFHPRTLLPMHIWTVAMRRTRSSVRRRPIDRAPVRFDTRAPCVFFFLYVAVPWAWPQLHLLAPLVSVGRFGTHLRPLVMRVWLCL